MKNDTETSQTGDSYEELAKQNHHQKFTRYSDKSINPCLKVTAATELWNFRP